ncbi:pyridoxamine 5'-phosphate oxidase family protein [Streptosporangium sp. DT93]|uniref:pyridoxamine 5'-phosphate oxidase family protein n=1 Tax=Streptosporangium sp. DT93 TaxID=3393428 RepID=UPI003CEA741D
MTGRVSAPGDLGRRIARRREDLGLTREELALRAGIDPGYLAYLEEAVASPNPGTVNRVATALDTRPEELLGGSTGPPPGGGTRPGQGTPSAWGATSGHGAPAGHDASPGHDGPVGYGRAAPTARAQVLDRDECLRLITPGGVGRIAFEGAGGPVIQPVDYALHGSSLIFRTAFGGPLEESPHIGRDGVETKIAFEADRIDDAGREGWSVMVRGGIDHVSSDEDRAALAALGVRPWTDDGREPYLRISATEITGRRIRRHA